MRGVHFLGGHELVSGMFFVIGRHISVNRFRDIGGQLLEEFRDPDNSVRGPV